MVLFTSSMKKILIGKKEGVAEVVEQIISEPEDQIVLVIPKGSVLADSVSNFHLLKREARTSEKDIIIESVDEEILALAKASHLESIHPLFEKKSRAASSLSDIIPTKNRKINNKEGDADDEAEDVEDIEEEFEEESLRKSISEDRSSKFKMWSGSGVSLRKKITIGVIILIVLGSIGVFTLNKMGKAQVSIKFKEIPWQYEGTITVSAAAKAVDAESLIIPGEIFTDSKNSSPSYPASGKASVQDKAIGKLTIYNAFSSVPQGLVATTRFMTPDGKIYRLDKAVTIPGAEIKDNKIVPSSIEVSVTADKAGPTYNSGLVSKLTIPGFKGTPKYDGFYGSLSSATGGFIGQRAVPTDKDISAAKAKVAEDLKNLAKSDFLNNRPADFKIIEGSSVIEVGSVSVNKRTDDKGNFSVFGEVKFSAIGFREADLSEALIAFANRDHSGAKFKKVSFSYSDPKLDLKSGKLVVSVTVNGTLTSDFSVKNFKSSIMGKKIDEIKTLTTALPWYESGRVKIWPIWLKTAPNKDSKVEVTVL